jgi:hypothetical protein
MACHVMKGAKQTAEHMGPACPVASDKCVSCHMPKVYDPEMHYKFADHRIRIAKEGGAYPE